MRMILLLQMRIQLHLNGILEVCFISIYRYKIRSTSDDLSNYMYQELIGVQVGKVPGQLNGEDFIIEDCKVMN